MFPPFSNSFPPFSNSFPKPQQHSPFVLTYSPPKTSHFLFTYNRDWSFPQEILHLLLHREVLLKPHIFFFLFITKICLRKAIATYCIASGDRPGLIASSGEVCSLSLVFIFYFFVACCGFLQSLYCFLIDTEQFLHFEKETNS